MAFVPTKARAVMDKTMQGPANKRRSMPMHASVGSAKGTGGRQGASFVLKANANKLSSVEQVQYEVGRASQRSKIDLQDDETDLTLDARTSVSNATRQRVTTSDSKAPKGGGQARNAEPLDATDHTSTAEISLCTAKKSHHIPLFRLLPFHEPSTSTQSKSKLDNPFQI